jgi:hypothetical protein
MVLLKRSHSNKAFFQPCTRVSGLQGSSFDEGFTGEYPFYPNPPLFMPLILSHRCQTGHCPVSQEVFVANHLVIGYNRTDHVNILTIKGKMGINDHEAM